MRYRKLLETELSSISQNIITIWENTNRDTSSTDNFQIVNFIPIAPKDFGGGGGFREEGIFQILLKFNFGDGMKNILTRAEIIRDTFYRGLKLEDEDDEVLIVKTPEIHTTYKDFNKIVLPISINYIKESKKWQ